jgi:hypothetical protein
MPGFISMLHVDLCQGEAAGGGREVPFFPVWHTSQIDFKLRNSLRFCDLAFLRANIG